MSNACSGEPGEVPDEEVNAHLGNTGLETSRRVTMRAWMCLLEMGLLMAGCTDNPSTQPGGRDGGIDGDRVRGRWRTATVKWMCLIVCTAESIWCGLS